MWVVMAFSFKNAPPTNQRVVNKVFMNYLDDFMKPFLDDFTIFSVLATHFAKLRHYFEKCWEYGISLNSKKCTFMVFSRMILGFIVSKEGKLPDPKKVKVIVKMPIPQNPIVIYKFLTC